MRIDILALAAGAMLASGTLVQEQQPRRDLSDLPPILQKSIKSHRTSRYSGQRTVEFKFGPERNNHIEYVLKDGVRSRTEFPGDSPYKGQIIVEDGTHRYHYFPDRNEIRIEPPRGREFGRHLRGPGPDGDHRHEPLRHTVVDGGPIAGFKTQLISASDANGNVLQKLWIEPRTGVVLKRVMFDPVGARIGYFEFSRINFNPKFAPGDFRIDRKGATVITPAMTARRLAMQLGLTPSILPESTGFQLEGARVLHPDGKDVLAQTYTGQEGRFTLFQLRAAVDQNRLQKMTRGRLASYSWERGGQGFALLGDLPQPRLREIARLLGDS